MSSAFLAQLPFIGSSSTLGWQHDDVAQSYMDHLLQRARVLLPRRGWRVGLIKEFYPRGASLLGLNVNAGSEVCIRFRIPGKKNEFLPFHEVLCTALHEFTHCVHSKHDRSFWNLYYDLVKECEALEVAMIQQGKQLYPDMPQTLATRRPITHPRGRAVSGAGTAATPRSRRKATGYRLGGADAGGRGQIGTHGRHVTQLITKAAPTHGTSISASTPKAGFPGEGQRLGSGHLHQCVTPDSVTPTRDALRRILADAAERRLMREQLTAPPAKVSSQPLVPQLDAGASFRECDRQTEVDDDNVPDCIPQSILEKQDGGGWRCPRCSFLNGGGSPRSCAFCADCDGGEEAEGTAPKRSRVDREHSFLEMPTVVVSSPTASYTVLAEGPQERQRENTVREYYVVSSDDDSTCNSNQTLSGWCLDCPSK
ncbi:hypothetical protein JKF63_02493 [Porcisia hertigi]|uniref:WLM domain-containing protein n=1 Tax=Porcisia hertigi TaxID=2761500 RepID=A0A836L3V2_9TRYP|nr:hypothetical protein JKF63_02493 [Porcisia hertigi]